MPSEKDYTEAFQFEKPWKHVQQMLQIRVDQAVHRLMPGFTTKGLELVSTVEQFCATQGLKAPILSTQHMCEWVILSFVRSRIRGIHGRQLTNQLIEMGAMRSPLEHQDRHFTGGGYWFVNMDAFGGPDMNRRHVFQAMRQLSSHLEEPFGTSAFVQRLAHELASDLPKHLVQDVEVAPAKLPDDHWVNPVHVHDAFSRNFITKDGSKHRFKAFELSKPKHERFLLHSEAAVDERGKTYFELTLPVVFRCHVKNKRVLVVAKVNLVRIGVFQAVHEDYQRFLHAQTRYKVELLSSISSLPALAPFAMANDVGAPLPEAQAGVLLIMGYLSRFKESTTASALLCLLHRLHDEECTSTHEKKFHDAFDEMIRISVDVARASEHPNRVLRDIRHVMTLTAIALVRSQRTSSVDVWYISPETLEDMRY